VEEKNPEPRVRRRWRVVRYALLIGLPVSVIGSWLVVQHRPGWYAPPRLDQDGLKRARREATERADDFGDRLVRRESFDLVLTETQVNEWLAVMPPMWETAENVQVTEPAVSFEPGVIRFGVLVDRSGWRFILSVAVSVTLCEGGRDVELRLVDARGGSFPVPRAALSWAAWMRGDAHEGRPADDEADSDQLDALVQDIQSVDDLLDGVKHRNRFVWPNGNRSFSIERLSIEPGRILVRIRPE